MQPCQPHHGSPVVNASGWLRVQQLRDCDRCSFRQIVAFFRTIASLIFDKSSSWIGKFCSVAMSRV